MSFCETVLRKPLSALQLSDLVEFFQTEQEESSVLEFKSGDVKPEGIHKEVAAFLNTEGGLLIIGAPIEKSIDGIKNKKVCVGELTKSTITNQDSLMRSIGSNISPAPIHIKSRTFQFGEGAVHVLDIPASMTPPHQVTEKGIYYIRFEKEAKAAPHGIVEALFQKRQKPNLIATLESYKPVWNKKLIQIAIQVKNESLITAENIGTIFSIHGVKSVTNHRNLPGNLEFKDEIAKTLYQDKGPIMVKGLTMDLWIEIEPLYPQFYISFEYYCLHGSAESLMCVMDINGQIIESYNSRNLTPENQQSDIFKKYEELRYGSLCRLLSIRKNFDDRLQVPFDKIFELESRLAMKFPDGFLEFFRIQNGFTGRLGNDILTLFNLDDLFQMAPYPLLTSDVDLLIGRFGNIPLFIRFENKDYTFGFMDFEQSDGQYAPLAKSFYSLLQQLQSGKFDELYPNEQDENEDEK